MRISKHFFVSSIYLQYIPIVPFTPLPFFQPLIHFRNVKYILYPPSHQGVGLESNSESSFHQRRVIGVSSRMSRTVQANDEQQNDTHY